jgi:hypothetical protein
VFLFLWLFPSISFPFFFISSMGFLPFCMFIYRIRQVAEIDMGIQNTKNKPPPSCTARSNITTDLLVARALVSELYARLVWRIQSLRRVCNFVASTLACQGCVLPVPFCWDGSVGIGVNSGYSDHGWLEVCTSLSSLYWLSISSTATDQELSCLVSLKKWTRARNPFRVKRKYRLQGFYL